MAGQYGAGRIGSRGATIEVVISVDFWLPGHLFLVTRRRDVVILTSVKPRRQRTSSSQRATADDGSSTAARVTHLENALEMVLTTLETLFHRHTALQAQVDHLAAKLGRQ